MRGGMSTASTAMACPFREARGGRGGAGLPPSGGQTPGRDDPVHEPLCRPPLLGYAVRTPKDLEGDMQRGSDRLSVHRDDEMKHELQGLLRSGHPTRTEEWHDPEPFADDDPEVARGPVTPGRGPTSLESV